MGHVHENHFECAKCASDGELLSSTCVTLHVERFDAKSTVVIPRGKQDIVISSPNVLLYFVCRSLHITTAGSNTAV